MFCGEIVRTWFLWIIESLYEYYMNYYIIIKYRNITQFFCNNGDFPDSPADW